MEQQHHLAELTVDHQGAEQLKGIAGWAKFLSIIGFIACVLLVIFGLFAATIMGSVSNYDDGLGGNALGAGLGVFMTVIYIVLAVIYFIPTLFLFQSANRLKAALATSDQGLLNEGLGKLRACFKFWGILTIIIIGLYLLAFLFGGLAFMMQ